MALAQVSHFHFGRILRSLTELSEHEPRNADAYYLELGTVWSNVTLLSQGAESPLPSLSYLRISLSDGEAPIASFVV